MLSYAVNTKNRDSNLLLHSNISDISELVSEEGGHVKSSSSPLEVIIKKGAVSKLTNFSIKKLDFSKIDPPQNFDVLSPFFELEPHSVLFNEPVFLQAKLEDAPDGLCLYKQENDENEKILNKWSIHFPKKIDGNKYQFELKSFCFAFFGKLDIGIDVNCNEIPNIDFNNKFKVHQYVYPGLNYRIKCENNECSGKSELIIINRGYGNFQPNNDIDTNDYTNLLKCPNCDTIITNLKSIKNIILFQARGEIDFKVNNKGESLRTSNYHVNGNQMIIYGENGENIQKYSTVLITVNQSSSGKSSGKNLVAGINEEMLQSRPSEPNGRNIDGFTTRLDLINLEQVEKLVQRALNRKIQEATSPNILDLAFCMDCTGN
jgi:hypothetical protein